MGWSERSAPRNLSQRVAELVAFCEQHTSGSIVLAAHDWGGPVALGAISSLDVEAVILGNTGVGVPERASVPPLIATARRFVDLVCRQTSLFVDGTAAMTKKEHRNGLRAPYRSADRRAAVATFVADIPLTETDESWDALQVSAGNLGELSVPLLLVWGGRDPVFHDRFLADLLERAPHADVHRFPEAAHLVPLDAPMATVAKEWLDGIGASSAQQLAPSETSSEEQNETFVPITDQLRVRSNDLRPAFTDATGSLSWQSLAEQSASIARLLVEQGMNVGDRVAMLVPPGAELLAASYGVWRAGGVLVVADSGLGAKGLRSVLRGANVKWVYGTPKTLVAAKALGFTPGARTVCTTRFPGAISVQAHRASSSTELPELRPTMAAAVVHTSGSTGPAKPVRYSHGALAAQRDVIRTSFEMSQERGFITSFAPFILLGPALGTPCVLPAIDLTKPSELDFDRFASVVASSQVDVAWLSPASARRIVETASGRTVQLRLVMLAGAPIPAGLASSIAAVTGADVRAPWGMTEAMPLSDGIGATIASDTGTATGTPLNGVKVAVLSLDDATPVELSVGEWGELAVHAPWMFEGYDQQWPIEHRSEVLVDGVRFHRTGDLGRLDQSGNLQQFGRVQHAISLSSGIVPNAFVEDPIAASIGTPVAAVGVGPGGTQVIAIVVQSQGGLRLADVQTTSRIRSFSNYEIAAVLEGELPVDIRHESKVKRELLAERATQLLAGR